MKFIKNTYKVEKLRFVLFTSFLFFSAIFCGYTKVNNLLHASIILFIITLIIAPETRRIFYINNNRKRGFIFVAIFLLYFAVSNLWGSNPINIESSLTHSFYIIMFLGMMVSVLESGNRMILIYACLAGLFCLSLYCLVFEYHSISQMRRVSHNFPGPENVIDISGYAAIGILLSLIAFRDKANKIVLLSIPVFLTVLIISQSRGPVIALLVPLLITIPFRKMTRKHAFLSVAIIIMLIAGLLYSALGGKIIHRFGELSTQIFLRLSIWSHTLGLVYNMPIFGHGFDYHLEFTNYSGEHIRTTHSVYFGALLKGGAVGLLLLLLMLAHGLNSLMRAAKEGMRLELCLFLFMMIFYLSQGLFVISNPTEYWYLFWFPLAFGLVGKRQATI
ncbi:O-antigen ligase family protein [Erwinia sp. P7711]|uniref:O-antigen ligase family protein n=1 Tax=Erwinia sp. P7711 TaxID=3141451 RepID=UPI00319959C5